MAIMGKWCHGFAYLTSMTRELGSWEVHISGLSYWNQETQLLFKRRPPFVQGKDPPSVFCTTFEV
jgi:hypothetical protein